MDRVIARFEPHVYAILRIVAGAMFAMHGTQKVMNWPASERRPPLSSLPGVAGILELVLGILIVIGLFAGLAAFIASGEMAVAYFMVHAPQGPTPLVNKGELAVLYCFVWLYVAARGAGIWSVDSVIHPSRSAPPARS